MTPTLYVYPLRLSADERDRWMWAARLDGRTLASWIRRACEEKLHRDIETRENEGQKAIEKEPPLS